MGNYIISLLRNLYVICKGHSLPDELEDEFLSYTHSGKLCIDEDMMNKLNRRLPLLFPESHYHGYPQHKIGQALEHIYFTSFRSGMREILYKAELNNIAYDIEKVPDYNIVGTTPETIVSHGVPLRLLRIFNERFFIEDLFDQAATDFAKGVYASYCGYIGKQLPSRSQWRYLEELYQNGGTFGGEGFSRALYDRMDAERAYPMLHYYKRFFQCRKKFPHARKMKLPGVPEIWFVTERLESYCELSGENSKLGKKVEKRHNYRAFYEYHNDKYCVVMPRTAIEMCEEAINQSNCLMNYIKPHADGETTILFIRQRNNPERSFVTMEVKDWEIRQVYGSCNSLPEEGVYDFLEEYAREMWIRYNPYDLILGNPDDDDDDEEMDSARQTLLMKFATKYKEKDFSEASRMDDDSQEYEQLSLAL